VGDRGVVREGLEGKIKLGVEVRREWKRGILSGTNLARMECRMSGEWGTAQALTWNFAWLIEEPEMVAREG
jgi:hypothetical protein